ncbi:tetratricopeptide repeat protein [Sedimenticola selenatireducens]|uniref:tetratricopeptide repeat protein n=1 Tax=Sedimenticola selenatireducens TaxID=191960 RepID=UPI002AAAABC6|nr:tetratricopeptide repeat protein [Sedimenticola selenatireducens]
MQRLEKSKAHFGKDSQITLGALNDVAIAKLRSGDYLTAEEDLLLSYEGLKNSVGINDPMTLTVANNLGFLYQSKGEFQKATPYVEVAYKTLKQHAPSDWRTLAIQNNLAENYVMVGRVDEAENFLRDVIDQLDQQPGRGEALKYEATNNLGTALVKQGKVEEAVRQFQSAIDGQQNSPSGYLIRADVYRANLASVLARQGELDAAAALYEQALQGRQDLLGEWHPETVRAVVDLGQVYHQQYRMAEAAVLYSRALEAAEAGVQPVAGPFGSVATVAGLQQRYADATNKRTLDQNGSGLQHKPYWNGWFERDGVYTQENLTPDHEYSFFLDLSAYDYSMLLAGAVASMEADRRLVERLEQADEKLRLRLRPLLAGAIEPAEPIEDIRVTIETERLNVASVDEKEAYEAFRAGEMNARAFSSIVSVASVRSQRKKYPTIHIPVIASETTGCGIVAFSVWDESGVVPLDYLVFRVAVGEQATGCLTDGRAAPFDSGLNSLLATSGGKRSIGDRKIEAGLHLFEVKQGIRRTRAFAVLVDGRDANNPDIYNWELDSLLSDNLNKVMPGKLSIAHSSKDDGAFAAVSNELRAVLFERVRDKEMASRAWEVLKELGQEKKLVAIRLTDTVGDILYVPLGLLHSGGGEQSLPGSLSFLQPLPYERYGDADRCVKNWSYLLPHKLSGVINSDSTLRAIDSNIRDTGWVRRIFNTVPDSIEYLSGASANSQPGGALPEGMVSIAHHADGQFWFDDERDKFIADAIQRTYPPGSVAVMVACEAAGMDYENRKALSRLNQHGVDLIIAAPFQVSATYALEVTKHLSDLMKDAHSTSGPGVDRRIVSLFNRAAARAGEELGTQRYKDMRHEFLVLGDQGVRLCAPGEGR